MRHRANVPQASPRASGASRRRGRAGSTGSLPGAPSSWVEPEPEGCSSLMTPGSLESSAPEVMDGSAGMTRAPRLDSAQPDAVKTASRRACPLSAARRQPGQSVEKVGHLSAGRNPITSGATGTRLRGLRSVLAHALTDGRRGPAGEAGERLRFGLPPAWALPPRQRIGSPPGGRKARQRATSPGRHDRRRGSSGSQDRRRWASHRGDMNAPGNPPTLWGDGGEGHWASAGVRSRLKRGRKG